MTQNIHPRTHLEQILQAWADIKKSIERLQRDKSELLADMSLIRSGLRAFNGKGGVELSTVEMEEIATAALEREKNN